MSLENQSPFQEAPQEKNLALERQEAVNLHNEILKEQKSLSETEKSTDKITEMSTLREKVGAIDKYKNLAKPFSDQYYYRIGDISSVEKLNKEKEKIDGEVEKVKSWIKDDTDKLNELRSSLGMGPTNDIPSLAIKKERLPYLLNIQSDLENKLNFEQKKVELQQEENSENKNREGQNLDGAIDSISSDIKKFSKLLEARPQEYSKIFKNEEIFRTLTFSTPEVSDSEGIKKLFSSIVEASADENLAHSWSLSDNTENLYSLSSSLRQLAGSLKEYAPNIQNEEERKELSGMISAAVDNINSVASLIATKAEAIKDYQNVRLP